ncbi:hypothetical protein PSACC_03406 [Paramicrosporidium saccamoebae]|uniref:non-specific serine/threonine protein kinase n=1 Tax=Paramicrosporidium saccamoebae TaxID=1246581 RepID=A0A2H9TGB8_9FUNG|nr:hypothetical protein PSACC_03406 [Paramicrosporidium saccamoebae]
MRNLAFFLPLLAVQCSSEWNPPDYASMTTAEIFALPGARLLSPEGNYQPIYPRMDMGNNVCQAPHFKLLKKLGEGRSGQVWSAIYIPLRKMVAIKCRNPEAQRELWAEDVRTEERILGMSSHPNIPKLHCTAMEYLHGMGIIHRDIKSTNVLMSNDCDVYLIDYDQAAYAPGGARDICGTDGRRAPEMLKVVYASRMGKLALWKTLKGREELADKAAEDLVDHLCELDPEKRWSFQNNNIDDMLAHSFFQTDKSKE